MNQCACGCGQNAQASFIKGHNRRREVAERFWEKVEIADCWEWTGAAHEAGYGRFNDGAKIVPSHRWAWENLVGKIAPGLHIDHLCRNPKCVNPDHLEPVTPGENARRGFGATAQRHRNPSRMENPPSATREYRRAKDLEHQANPQKRARKLELQRIRRATALLTLERPR